jgi:hypothetical protein
MSIYYKILAADYNLSETISFRKIPYCWLPFSSIYVPVINDQGQRRMQNNKEYPRPEKTIFEGIQHSRRQTLIPVHIHCTRSYDVFPPEWNPSQDGVVSSIGYT